MAGMTDLASSAAYTVADLHAMPDDGRRRELIDGMLFVSPAPGWPHQEMALTLYTQLRAACPPEGAGTVEVLELDGDGRFAAVAEAVGDEAVTVGRPFAVTVSPAALLAGLRRPSS